MAITLFSSIISNAFKVSLSLRKLLNSTLTYPENTYYMNFRIIIHLIPFTYMLEALIFTVSESVGFVKDIRSIFGDNWQNAVKQALFNELYMVVLFIENSRTTPRISMDSYKAFITDRLTLGAARLLVLEAKQSENHFLGSDLGRVTLTYNMGLTSPYLLSFVPLIGLDVALVPVWNGTCFLSPNDLYVFGCLEKHFPSFARKPHLIENTTNLPFPTGEVFFTETPVPEPVVPPVVAAPSVYDAATVNNIYEYTPKLGASTFTVYTVNSGGTIVKSSVGFNLLYNQEVTGDLLIYGNSIYNSYVMPPNWQEFKYMFLELWTNISGTIGDSIYYTGDLYGPKDDGPDPEGFYNGVRHPEDGSGDGGDSSNPGNSPNHSNDYKNSKKGNGNNKPAQRKMPSGVPKPIPIDTNPRKIRNFINSIGDTGLKITKEMLKSPVLVDYLLNRYVPIQKPNLKIDMDTGFREEEYLLDTRIPLLNARVRKTVSGKPGS